MSSGSAGTGGASDSEGPQMYSDASSRTEDGYDERLELPPASWVSICLVDGVACYSRDTPEVIAQDKNTLPGDSCRATREYSVHLSRTVRGVGVPADVSGSVVVWQWATHGTVPYSTALHPLARHKMSKLLHETINIPEAAFGPGTIRSASH